MYAPVFSDLAGPAIITLLKKQFKSSGSVLVGLYVIMHTGDILCTALEEKKICMAHGQLRPAIVQRPSSLIQIRISFLVIVRLL